MHGPKGPQLSVTYLPIASAAVAWIENPYLQAMVDRVARGNAVKHHGFVTRDHIKMALEDASAPVDVTYGSNAEIVPRDQARKVRLMKAWNERQ